MVSVTQLHIYVKPNCNDAQRLEKLLETLGDIDDVDYVRVCCAPPLLEVF